MANLYVYFISSLPLLHFGSRAPFSAQEFLQRAQELIPSTDVAILRRSLVMGGDALEDTVAHPTLRKIAYANRTLRNEIAKLRASRRHTDAARYIRGEAYTQPACAVAALNAHRNPSILEGELMLDAERWRLLDEIASGHYFDLDFLLTYISKLCILQRWEGIHAAHGDELLQEAVAGGAQEKV